MTLTCCSKFYDAFVSIRRVIFSTRNRAEHTRKRKIISHIFSAKSVSRFEPYMEANLQELVRQWNRMSDAATRAGDEYADMDCLQWFHYTAFDIIADLVHFPQRYKPLRSIYVYPASS